MGEPARTGLPLHGVTACQQADAIGEAARCPGALEIIRAYEEWRRVSVTVDPLSNYRRMAGTLVHRTDAVAG